MFLLIADNDVAFEYCEQLCTSAGANFIGFRPELIETPCYSAWFLK